LKQAALITGASDRIGRSIALSLAEMGYSIALHYHRSESQAARTRQELVNKGVTCRLFRADFRRPEHVDALFRNAAKAFDVSVLVNNASIYVKSSLLDQDDKFQSLFDVNLRAPYILTRQFALALGGEAAGHVINILDAKIAGNSMEHFDYLLTKKSLASFTEMAAQQLAPNIRVNGVAPGAILPPAGQGPEWLLKLADGVPLKRAGSPGGVAEAIQYLLRADYVTGQVIFVDGGEHLQGSAI
jgi:glucose 1-dehydrogenase